MANVKRIIQITEIGAETQFEFRVGEISNYLSNQTIVERIGRDGDFYIVVFEDRGEIKAQVRSFLAEYAWRE